jgi:hypothetical protein
MSASAPLSQQPRLFFLVSWLSVQGSRMVDIQEHVAPSPWGREGEEKTTGEFFPVFSTSKTGVEATII